MIAKNHPDFNVEVDRLELTKEYIHKTLDSTEEYRSLYKDNIKDAMVNLDYLDSSQSYISVLINTKFIEMADRNFESLSRAQNKPYFARIDFKQEGSNSIDKLYIGKTSLFKAEDRVPLIIDWRSPIANVYYEGRLGNTQYEAEGEIQEGELLLKRQYTIEDGKLREVLDVDITTNDAFLQATLDANAEKKLKDIASTIQSEQNRVIRADMDKPLIVQGVAGSGKTTIALHRIAYFIYTFEKTFDPENFMIIAPNRLFINYISEVLPELGVEKVKQTTFIDFMVELLGNKYKLEDINKKLMSLIHSPLNSNGKKEHELMKWYTKYKGSMEFKNLLDKYIGYLEENFTPDVDFKLDDRVLVSAGEIKKKFISEFTYLPLYKRINEIKKTLTNQLKLAKNDILNTIEHKYDGDIEHLRDTMDATEERREKITRLISERDEKLESIIKESKNVVKKYLSLFPKVDLFEYYKDLLTNKTLIKNFLKGKVSEEEIEYLCDSSIKLLDNKKI